MPSFTDPFYTGGGVFDAGNVMPDRNLLVSTLNTNGTFAGSSGQQWWTPFVTGGLSILNTYLQSKLNPSAPAPISASAIPIPGFQAGAIVPVLTGGAAGAAAGMSEAGVMAALRALGAKIVGKVARVAPEIFASIPSAIKQAAAALGISILADEAVKMFGGDSGSGKHRRRMNYLNPRAARRAITRIKGVRKTLHRIEKSLPVRKVHAKVGKRR